MTQDLEGHMPVILDATPAVRAWMPQATALSMISDHVVANVHVLLRPRADLAALWAWSHPDNPALPRLPAYAFRAWCIPSKNEIVILVDGTETPQSITWLLLHELVHRELRHSPLIAEALGRVRKPHNYLTSDDAHQAHPEERICDWIATIWYRKLGYAPPWRMDRRWWRARVRR